MLILDKHERYKEEYNLMEGLTTNKDQMLYKKYKQASSSVSEDDRAE